MSWEDTAKEKANECLKDGFAIFDFQISYVKGTAKIVVFLDKLSDPLGSPTIKDCQDYAKAFDLQLIALTELGELSQLYTIEVSSPGAEREINIPDDLDRFKERPLKVFYEIDGKERQAVFNLLEKREAEIDCTMANVKYNLASGMYKKKEAKKVYTLPLSRIKKVKLYLDF